jgi:hypothetical protein
LLDLQGHWVPLHCDMLRGRAAHVQVKSLYMYINFRLQLRPAPCADLCGALLIAIALLAWPAVAVRAGDIYKYVDAEGHVVYSDHFDASQAQQAPMEIQPTEPVSDVEMRSSEAPPPLPDNEQPACSDEGDLWTPGYWASNDAGYYWVPGAWVQPPRVDLLWTPGYWTYVDDLYVFHRGYWAEEIGYYGGINYGFGYFGVGFAGGRWVNHSFAYNRAVSNVDARVIRNTYSETFSNNAAVSRVSYNGGPGGTNSVMTARERAVGAERHFPPTPMQRQTSTLAARTPAVMPHVPGNVYHSERSADDRNIEPTQKPAVLNAPVVAAARASAPPTLARQHEPTRAPPTSRTSSQAAAPHPSKPAPTRPASSKALSVMPYPKS